MVIPTLRILGHLITGLDQQMNEVLKDKFFACLSHTNINVRREALICWNSIISKE